MLSAWIAVIPVLLARPRGINSSMMLWQAGQHQHLFDFLLLHYYDITKVIYKFDHYLEMMLYNADRSASASGSCDPAPGWDHALGECPEDVIGLESQPPELSSEAGSNPLAPIPTPTLQPLPPAPPAPPPLAAATGLRTEPIGDEFSERLGAASEKKSRLGLPCHCYFLQHLFPGKIVDYVSVTKTAAAVSSGSCSQRGFPSVGSRRSESGDELVLKGKQAGKTDLCLSPRTDIAVGASVPNKTTKADLPAIVCFPLKPKPHELLTLWRPADEDGLPASESRSHPSPVPASGLSGSSYSAHTATAITSASDSGGSGSSPRPVAPAGIERLAPLSIPWLLAHWQS